MTQEQEIKLLELLVSISKGILNEFNKIHSQLSTIEKRLSSIEQRLINDALK